MADTAVRLKDFPAGAVGFHWRDGWFFKRMPDASVQIRVFTDSTPEGMMVQSMNIPDTVWASIVTTVSAHNETGETWRAFLATHRGERPF